MPNIVKTALQTNMLPTRNALARVWPDNAVKTAEQKEKQMTTFTYNSKREYGLEVKFDGKPSQNIRNALKYAGFWWDGKEGVWYLAKPVTLRIVRQEPVIRDGFKDALQTLRDYCGLTLEQSNALEKEMHETAECRAVEGMLMAQGII